MGYGQTGGQWRVGSTECPSLSCCICNCQCVIMHMGELHHNLPGNAIKSYDLCFSQQTADVYVYLSEGRHIKDLQRNGIRENSLHTPMTDCPGIEPGIICLSGRCVAHWAHRPLNSKQVERLYAIPTVWVVSILTILISCNPNGLCSNHVLEHSVTVLHHGKT